MRCQTLDSIRIREYLLENSISNSSIDSFSAFFFRLWVDCFWDFIVSLNLWILEVFDCWSVWVMSPEVFLTVNAFLGEQETLKSDSLIRTFIPLFNLSNFPTFGDLYFFSCFGFCRMCEGDLDSSTKSSPKLHDSLASLSLTFLCNFSAFFMKISNFSRVVCFTCFLYFECSVLESFEWYEQSEIGISCLEFKDFIPSLKYRID